MEFLPYPEFSALQISQFVPSSSTREDNAGLRETLEPFNLWQHCFRSERGFLAFYYPDSPAKTLAAIQVRLLDPELPAGVAERISQTIAAPLRPGMLIGEITALLGQPDSPPIEQGMCEFHRFRVGSRWPYRVGCVISSTNTLSWIWVMREDYFQSNETHAA